MNRTLALVLVVGCIALVPVVTASTSISGTVTVENGTADGAKVTIAPVSEEFQRVDDQVTTTVNGTTFSADVPDAPVHVVRIVHDGAVHYEVVRNETSVDVTLNRSLDGRVVDSNGDPRPNATVELVDAADFSVDRARAGANGTFSFGPLQPNATYRLSVTVDGVPYQRTVTTASENQRVTVSTPPPTSDEGALNVSGGNPAGHVVQVMAPQNGSDTPSVVETVSLRNTADRPYVGPVTLTVPTDGRPYSAMAQGRETDYRTTPEGVVVNVSIAANETARLGVAYDLPGQTFEKRLGRDTHNLAVVLRGYDPETVEHSANLRVGDAPIALLTNADPVSANETIRLNVSGARSASERNVSSETAPSESNSVPTFPAVPIFGGLAAMVVGGLVAYRTL
ncbi:carboxypeptidase-like regulatory domain-containing protein [Halorussus salinisoli]|uniref:carboxypeptidase-like regulatory domain-containing protein n=1 Tax=Halorussus salinisoli TaxID=2558242 RepID=UPI0010C21955|nr:carboxypeptidase-like regulatory domain-containing protein [Halorussus salinisoli]